MTPHQVIRPSPCRTCDTARHPKGDQDAIDIEATTAALVERVASGRMRVLRGDVPLEDMVALLESDMKYMIVSFLECLECQRVVFWGLCIRGNPIFTHKEIDDVSTWPWGAVPPRAQWSSRP